MMKHWKLIPIAAAFALLFSGCFYTHTFQPLTTDVHHTPVTNVEKQGSITLITFPPITGNYNLVAWGSAAIGDVAKKENMREIYFADLEVFSVLHVWNQYTVHVYGK